MKPQFKQHLVIVVLFGLLMLLMPASAIAGTGGAGGRLSVTTATAAVPSVPRSKAGRTSIRYRVRVQGTGWRRSVRDGAKTGTIGKSRNLEAVRIKLYGMKGGVRYRVRVQGSGWQRWKRNGKTASVTGTGKRLNAIQVKLTGSAAKQYDICYCVYVQGSGWTKWVRNGATAGTTSKTKRVEALQIKLKVKSSKKPDPEPLPAPSPDEKTLNGIEVSGETGQVDITRTGADFVLIRATDGTYGTQFNPMYRQQADEALNAGCLVGFYHVAKGGDPVQEADVFYDAVKDYKGRAAVALVWEGGDNSQFDNGTDVSWCKRFLDRVKSRYGGTPLLRLHKNHTNAYDWSSVARTYPLWGVECGEEDPVTGFQQNPWQSKSKWGAWGSTVRIHHYTDNGVIAGCDSEVGLDLFYGTKTDWASLCQ